MGSTKSIQRLLLMLLLTLSFFTAMPATFMRPAKAQTTDVTISDLAFNPQNVTIKVGSTITWTNSDPLIYTLWFVKANDQTTYTKAGKEGLSDPILPETSWSETFNEIVTVQYYSFERLWITGFITVVPLVPPTASFTYSPSKPLTGQTVAFNAYASSDTDGNIISYAWNFSDGITTTESVAIVYHAFEAFGTYNVTLTVTDDDGLTDTTFRLVTIYEAPVAAFTYAPTTPLIGETVTFNASQSTDADGTITSYFWDFDDGVTEIYVEGTNLTSLADHAYASDGTHNVTLTVIDNDDITNSTWKTVTILHAHDIAVIPPIKVSIMGEDALSEGTIRAASGENITITVVVKNEGTVAETFTVTVYSNDTTIDTQTVTDLAADSSETLEFVWETYNATEGNYTIEAEASQVTGETDTADNTLTAGVTVIIKMPFVIFPYIGIVGLILLIIVIIVLGLGAYIYFKRKRVSKS